MNKTLVMTIAAFLSTIIVIPIIGLGDTRPANSGKHPDEEITPLTREQLNTKVPHFYCFEYRANPQPGKRYWLRVSDRLWIERYPDGFESRFKVLGHTIVHEMQGTIVVKVSGDEGRTGANNVGGLQAFIPDKGNKVMHHWYRNGGRGDENWNDLAPMQSIE